MTTRRIVLLACLLSFLLMATPLWLESYYPMFAQYVYEHDLAAKIVTISLSLTIHVWILCFIFIRRRSL